MKREMKILFAASIVSLLTAVPWAQESTTGMRVDSMGDSSHMTSNIDSSRNYSATHGYGVTPQDQKNNKTDVNITKDIRREIMATKGMSVNAQNVKIITIDGMVTLRGKVDSSRERDLIEKIAVRIAGSGKVTNDLQAK